MGRDLGFGLGLVNLAICALSCEDSILGSSTGVQVIELRIKVGGNTFPFWTIRVLNLVYFLNIFYVPNSNPSSVINIVGSVIDKELAIFYKS